MKVTNIRREDDSHSVRVLATISYEDSDRPPLEAFHQTSREFAPSVVANPDAFLLACVFPAIRHGERRVFKEGEVCPRLRQGVVTAMHWMRYWYGPTRRVIDLDVQLRSQRLLPGGYRDTGLFFSGGIDSLTSLRVNRLNIPPEHPASIRHGILVSSFGISRAVSFPQVLAAAQAVAGCAKMSLVPVATNVRTLEGDPEFWKRESHGALLSSVAHVLAGKLSLVHSASSDDIPTVVPWGSHVALDQNYGGHDLAIHHDGSELSRFAKARIVADWDVGLQYLCVCTRDPEGALNCGRCEKSVRTMLMLLALGALHRTQAFGQEKLTVESLRQISIRSRWQELYYEDVLPPLRRLGYEDLARAVQQVLDEYRRYRRWVEEKGWKGTIKRWDRRMLGGFLLRARRGGEA